MANSSSSSNSSKPSSRKVKTQAHSKQPSLQQNTAQMLLKTQKNWIQSQRTTFADKSKKKLFTEEPTISNKIQMEKTKSTLQLSDSQKSQLVSGIQTKSTAMTIVNNYVEPLNPNQVP